SYGYVLHLHSFPTRRSSDLSAARLGVGNRQPGGSGRDHRRPRARDVYGDFAPVAHVQGGSGGHPGAALRPEDGAAAPGGGGFQKDRKSTRLNSSHRTISYAV